jgi:dienelactone hydrolase
LQKTLALLIVVAVASACAGDDDDATTADTTAAASTTTTISVADAAQAYTEPGPYPIGITTLALAGDMPVEVWYPAVEGTTGTDTYDVHDLVPETLSNLLTADVPASFTIDALREADVADGEFPLVLFSHGASGFRYQSSFLTSHLASWGMVVAAPDHWSRDLYHFTDRILGGPAVTPNDSVDDLRLTRELMETEHTTAGSPFEGHLVTDMVAAMGHSAGGFSALALASNPEIDGYVSLASGAGNGRPDTSSSAPPAEVEMPDKPSLFMAGKADAVASWDTLTKVAFDAATEPSWFWALDAVGHNGFTDLCTFANGTGVIGVAVASGLGGFLDTNPEFRRLGEDGCVPPAAPVADTFPIVQHAVTAFLRNLFGVDPEPVGLGPEVADAYAVPVEIEEKL